MRKTIESLAGLATIGGGILDVAFRKALTRTLEDLDARPSVSAAREITLKIRLAPVAAESGILDSIDSDFELTTKVPSHRTRSYSMTVGGNDGLVYNDMSPDNHRQMTLDQEQKELQR